MSASAARCPLSPQFPDASSSGYPQQLDRRHRYVAQAIVRRRAAGRRTGSCGTAGYDELTVAEIEPVLGEGDEQHVKEVVAYERAHKNRAGVL